MSRIYDMSSSESIHEQADRMDAEYSQRLIAHYYGQPRKCRTAMVMAAKKARKERMKLNTGGTATSSENSLMELDTPAAHQLPMISLAIAGIAIGLSVLAFFH